MGQVGFIPLCASTGPHAKLSGLEQWRTPGGAWMGPAGSGLGTGDIFPLGAKKTDRWAAISRLRVVLIFRLSHVGGQIKDR